MGRKSIPILLKATSPEGETKTFTSIGEAAKELGFSEHGVGKAYHAKRNRIGEYELEWLEPEPKPVPELVPKSKFAMIKESKIINCSICGQPLTAKDRMDDRCFVMEDLDSKGNSMLKPILILPRCMEYLCVHLETQEIRGIL